jgi:hypothetical protein
MNGKLLAIGLITAATTVATAGPIRRTYISEMSANPDAGSVTANLHHAVASHIGLVAVNDPIDVRKVTLHMSDGRSYVVPNAIRLRTGEQGVVALPCRTRCTIDAISLDYDRRDQKEGARVRIYSLDETDAPARQRDPGYDEARPYPSSPSDRAYR